MKPLIQSLSRQALLLIDEHHRLLFDLHKAFTKGSPSQKEAIQNLVDDIKAFSPHAYDVQEQPLANRCRLLALVLCEPPNPLSQEKTNVLLDNLLALLSSIRIENPPNWLAAHLLVTESLFTLAKEPRSITLPREGEPVVPEPIQVGPSRTAARNTVFELCLRLLSLDDLQSDESLSVLRLFVLFTRQRDLADRFVEANGPGLLFQRLRASPSKRGSSYIATILRHLVEDDTTIRNIMQHGIKRYITTPRPRIVEISTYVKNCVSIALRDVDAFIESTFIESTKALCQLSSPYGPMPRLEISLLPDVVKSITAPKPESTDKVADSPPTNHTPSSLVKLAEAVVHLLIHELKDPPASDNLDAKYGRLPALAEPCNRLLTVHFNTLSSSRKNNAEVPAHVSKTMLEKDFVSTLTTALSKIAMKMSRSSSKLKEEEDESSGSESSASEDEDEDVDVEREETPDLYRNSALGMYAGEMDDGRHPENEEMDGEEYGDTDKDVEMDYGEKTGSGNTSNTDEDGGEDEMILEDVVQDEGILEANVEEYEADGNGVPIQIIHEDEADVGSPHCSRRGAEDSNQEQSSKATGGSREASTSQQQPEASTSAAPERITAMIHGSPVNITDTGIDPDFLAALPDDMREGVLNQHVRDQRAARVERPADLQISTEFLDALPPDIRAEILQQEALERERRRAEESAAASRGPAEIDPASFIASLYPTLRQAVSMEQDEGFIGSLPSHMLAEVEKYHGPPGPVLLLDLPHHGFLLSLSHRNRDHKTMPYSYWIKLALQLSSATVLPAGLTKNIALQGSCKPVRELKNQDRIVQPLAQHPSGRDWRPPCCRQKFCYPIVLLLGLLVRQSLLRTDTIMESVVGLLAIVTRPVTSLKDAKPPASIGGPSIGGSSQEAATSEAAPPSEALAAASPPTPAGQALFTETAA
ncbi:hypothetical protein H1R20_g15823, partial [Candolleomyces eurysporus]